MTKFQTMKNLIYILLLLCSIALQAQNTMDSADDYSRISLDVFIPDEIGNIPASAKSLLVSRLTQAVTDKGMAGAGASPRFLLTAKMDVLSSDIAPGAPPTMTYHFDVSLYIVDFIDQIIVSSTSFEVRGAGNNENRAYTNALRTINMRNPRVDRFLDEGKTKIIEYYNARCDFIIARAKAEASQRQYENALNILASIPEVSKDCYMSAMKEIGPIYKEFADFNCQILINAAAANWAASQNFDGAQLAGALIVQIDPGSKCYGEARLLIDKIERKILADENRNWKFMEKVFENEVMLESLRIRAWRDVGVAWGKGQQPTYNSILWVFR